MIQDILYLQAAGSAISSQVLGVALVRGGEPAEVPREPAAWPYQTVGEAVKDGWRIVKFPELALLVDEARNYGMGCEFILEKLHD